MDNQLIEQLAQKFSTTTEHLWGVLIKQAYVSATISLVWVILATLGIFGLYKFYRANYRENGWGDIPEFLFALGCVIYIFVLIFLIQNMMCGYISPEYWALSHLLR